MKTDGTILEAGGEGPRGGVIVLETDAEREADSTGGPVGATGLETVFGGCPLGSPGAEISSAAVAEGRTGSGIGTEELNFIGGKGGSEGVRIEPDKDIGPEEISEEEADFTEGSTVLSSLGLDTAVPGEVEPEVGAEAGLSSCEESDTGLEGSTGIPEGPIDSEADFIIGSAVVRASGCSNGKRGFTGDLTGAICLEVSIALSREVVIESGVCSWEETDSGPDTGHTSGAEGPDANFTGGRESETGLPGGPSANSSVEAGFAGTMIMDSGPEVDFTGSIAGASFAGDKASAPETLRKEAGISELEIGAKGVTG